MIWDVEIYNNIKCEEVKNCLIIIMEIFFLKWKGEYVKDEYFILNNLNKIGIIYIGYYGLFYYDENDIMYLKILNKILIGVGIVFLCCVLLFGLIMVEGLSRLILKVINIVEMILKGDYS